MVESTQSTIPSLSLVLPVYRESPEQIYDCLQNLKSFFDSLPIPVEVVIVADGNDVVPSVLAGLERLQVPRQDLPGAFPRPAVSSPDSSDQEETRGQSAHLEQNLQVRLSAKILPSPHRRGKARSALLGIQNSTGLFVSVIACDLGVPLAEVLAAIQVLLDSENLGWVIGDRKSQKKPRTGQRGFWQKLFEDVQSERLKAEFTNTKDPLTPFFLLRRQAWNLDQMNLPSSAWLLTPQMLRWAREQKIEFEQIPIRAHDRPSPRFPKMLACLPWLGS